MAQWEWLRLVSRASGAEGSNFVAWGHPSDAYHRQGANVPNLTVKRRFTCATRTLPNINSVEIWRQCGLPT
jgi:hypothetical protein